MEREDCLALNISSGQHGSELCKYSDVFLPPYPGVNPGELMPDYIAAACGRWIADRHYGGAESIGSDPPPSPLSGL